MNLPNLIGRVHVIFRVRLEQSVQLFEVLLELCDGQRVLGRACR